MSEVRTRFAPSPTGYMHIGGMRTALFNWLWARHTGGKFILRIDDTDRQRNNDEALQPILTAFRWLDMSWDEGPEIGGPHGPYFQSQRGEIYRSAADRLLKDKKAYRDFETPAEVQQQREAADKEKRPFISSRKSLELSEAEVQQLVAQGRPHVIRFLVPRGVTVALDDVVRGHVEWDASLIADPVIMRGDGTPLYNFATVVDDAAMDITHVIRAEEHLSNTPPQILMHQALGHTLPVFAHIPFVTAPGTTKKLSKRDIKKYRENPKFRKMFEDADRVFPQIGLGSTKSGSPVSGETPEGDPAETLNPVMVEYYEKIGFLPHAVFNSLARLGWSLDDRTEFMSRETIVENFTLDRIVKNPAGLDPDKLYSFQTHWMGQLSLEEKVARVLPYLIQAGLVPQSLNATEREYVARVVQTLGERLKVSSDILDARDFFVADDALEYDEATFKKRMTPEGTPERLRRFRERLASVEPFAPGPIEEAFRAFVDSEKIKPADLIHAVRVAVTGKSTGPGLFECLGLLGRQRSLNRIDRALSRQTRIRIKQCTSDSAQNQMTDGPRSMDDANPSPAPQLDFVRSIVAEDQKTGKYDGRVMTRFPPEPNGYLHIGHAKSICLNFGIALEFGGKCNLRFDDTNPTKEDVEYVDSIKEDIRWLGFSWEDREFYASDYFEQLYQWAEQLIQEGHAYVCSLNAEQIREYRGTLTEPGKPSPDRNRPPGESLDLFRRMRAGEFKDGQYTLRAKIDMASPNVNMRDPVLYRILKATHHRTGVKWCIYPMYDYAHGQSDSIEGVTHSICTLEFENHRPLYDWCLETLRIYHPQQIEFARLSLAYTMMSKRKLLELVEKNYVSGWDDPRMPTICGLRRRGYTPESIRTFCERIGVTKYNSVTEKVVLENAIREDLNRRAARAMAVLRPLKVVLENYPEDLVEELDAVNNPEDPAMGSRKVPFSRVLYIEHDDFREDPPKEFFRLAPGREVRLRYGYIIKCISAVKDPQTGEVTELRCTYDPATRGGNAPDGRKIKSTIHWVSAKHAVSAEVRLYDHLFMKEDPDDVPPGDDYKSNLNPNSLAVVAAARLEPSLASARAGDRFQFERLGYFCVDSRDSRPDALVFNRTVSLRDTWAKVEKKSGGKR